MRMLTRRRMPFIVFLALLGGVLAPSTVAQEARFFVPADSFSVGDRFRVAMVVDRPESSVARFPDPARGDTTLGDLEILDLSRSTLPLSRGLVRDSVSYLVTTFALDSAVVPPQQVTLVAGADTTVISSRTLIIPIRSLVPDTTGDVRDLAPIVPFERNLVPWILAAIAALLAAVIAYDVYRRRRRRPAEPPPRPKPLLPPYEEAVQRLNRLGDYDLSRQADVKPYYVELSDILRTYIERRAGFPALESTTRELVRELERAQMGGFSSTAVARIRTVLERSDLVKFADAKPAAEAGREAAHDTREVVDEIERSVKAAEAAASEAARPVN